MEVALEFIPSNKFSGIRIKGNQIKECKYHRKEGIFSAINSNAYMQKTCDAAEKAILAKKNLQKKCVNRDKM